MTLLIIAALVWLLSIWSLRDRLRDRVVARSARSPFRRLFSLLTIGALVALLIWAWRASWTTPLTPLWYAPNWLRWVLAAVMLVAFLLFVASVSQPNPTLVGRKARRRGRRAESSA